MEPKKFVKVGFKYAELTFEETQELKECLTREGEDCAKVYRVARNASWSADVGLRYAIVEVTGGDEDTYLLEVAQAVKLWLQENKKSTFTETVRLSVPLLHVMIPRLRSELDIARSKMNSYRGSNATLSKYLHWSAECTEKGVYLGSLLVVQRALTAEREEDLN